jgi:pyridoxal phosphate enzyme (YggS family)
MEAAEKETGREGEVIFTAAVKSADTEEINYLHRALGVKDIGENRVQQLLSRYDQLDRDGLNIHFIGSLQTNKVKYIIDKVCLIHSLDSVRLAAEIDKQARKIGKVQDVLIEINCGNEENKGGVLPEDAEAFWDEVAKFENVRVLGFMTMAPKCEKNEEYHYYFSKTCKLVLDIWNKKMHNISRPIISMGMSGSFEQAIRDGSTMIRVGRVLFEK